MFVGVAGRFIHSLLWGLTQRSHIATGRRPQRFDQVAKRGERFNGNQRGAERKVHGFRLEHPTGQRANRSVRKFAEDVFTVAVLHALVNTQRLPE
jgi:hypothetical protein